MDRRSLPLKDSASRAHLGDLSTLWRVFTRYVGITPADYRDRSCEDVVTAVCDQPRFGPVRPAGPFHRRPQITGLIVMAEMVKRF